jgi:hypothetical protein
MTALRRQWGHVIVHFQANATVAPGDVFAGAGGEISGQSGRPGQTLPSLSTEVAPNVEGKAAHDGFGDGYSFQPGGVADLSLDIGGKLGIGAGLQPVSAGLQRTTTLATPSLPDVIPTAWLNFMDFIIGDDSASMSDTYSISDAGCN